LKLITKFTSNRDIRKYFNQGVCTRLGITFSDSAAPEAYDFIVDQLSKVLFRIMALPDSISLQLSLSLTVDDANLPSSQITNLSMPSTAGKTNSSISL